MLEKHIKTQSQLSVWRIEITCVGASYISCGRRRRCSIRVAQILHRMREGLVGPDHHKSPSDHSTALFCPIHNRRLVPIWMEPTSAPKAKITMRLILIGEVPTMTTQMLGVASGFPVSQLYVSTMSKTGYCSPRIQPPCRVGE